MPINPVFTALLLAAAIAIAPASANAQRDCAESRVPADMPGVDAVVDSMAVASLIAETGARGVLRFSIVADVGGEPQVYPIADGSAPKASEWLAPQIEESLRRTRKASTPWGVRLIVSAGSVPAISLERSEYCRAQAMPSTTRATIQVVRRADAPPIQISAYTVRISAGGNVHGVTFLRPSDRDVEAQIRRAAVGMRYHPARIDGVPVASVDTVGRH